MINTTSYTLHVLDKDGNLRHKVEPDDVCHLRMAACRRAGLSVGVRGQWPAGAEDCDVIVSLDVANFIQSAETRTDGIAKPLTQLISENGWRVFSVMPGAHKRVGNVIESNGLRQVV